MVRLPKRVILDRRHVPFCSPCLTMPHKYNADRRHRIPKARYKVTNWRDYEAGLRKRGSLTIWFSDDAVEAWRAAPRTTPGGQARYSDLAIETSLIFFTSRCGRPRGWLARCSS